MYLCWEHTCVDHRTYPWIFVGSSIYGMPCLPLSRNFLLESGLRRLSRTSYETPSKYHHLCFFFFSRLTSFHLIFFITICIVKPGNIRCLYVHEIIFPLYCIYFALHYVIFTMPQEEFYCCKNVFKNIKTYVCITLLCPSLYVHQCAGGIPGAVISWLPRPDHCMAYL